MKELLVAGGIPTARHATCTSIEKAEAFLRTLPGGYVVKTDYLALGKGVLVTDDIDEAIGDARAKLDHGAVVIEERLEVVEFSLLAVCDGNQAVLLPPAMDHKRIFNGDTGPNTGGMGAVSPVPRLSQETIQDAFDRCVQPTLAALRARGIDYRGVLYGGPIMLTADGPRVVEWNARWGDPEAQVLLPLFESDPYEIEGVSAARALADVEIFSAGVGPGPTTAGGRVLNVTGLGADVNQARARAYEAVSMIGWPGMQYRQDIGLSALT